LAAAPQGASAQAIEAAQIGNQPCFANIAFTPSPIAYGGSSAS
jgi:hypothetical protein